MRLSAPEKREPRVTCATCHRGQLKLALNLDADGAEKVN